MAGDLLFIYYISRKQVKYVLDFPTTMLPTYKSDIHIPIMSPRYAICAFRSAHHVVYALL